MNDRAEIPETKKQWWKEANVLIGFGGVVATVIVGVVTYWLTAGSVSREYQERIKAARNDVLTAVARSIGEGVVPSKEKVESVLSSIRRQYGIKEQDFETPETVIDDILARVLANEFLDAKRREELSNKLLVVKAEKAAGSEDKKGAELKPERLGADRFTALAMGALAATLAAMTLTLMGDRFKRTIKEVIRAREDTASSRERSELVFRQALLTVTVLAGIVVAMWLLFIVVGKEPGIWPFIPR